MKLDFLFKHYTIRQRLTLLNILRVLFLVAIVGVYTNQVISLEHKVVTMEQIDDLFQNILEVRRYEKNIMLRLEGNSISNAEKSLEKIKYFFDELAPTFKMSEEKEIFTVLQKDFQQYMAIFYHWRKSGQFSSGCSAMDSAEASSQDCQLIREQGQKLADDATDLVRHKRKTLSSGFKKTLLGMSFFTIAILVCEAILSFSQVRSIINRLTTLDKATQDLAIGEFKQIPTFNTQDEINNLIIHFNHAIEELEKKQEQLIQSKKMASIGTFSSGIAHEINNPLNNISLSTDTLIEEFDTLEEDEIKEILNDIMSQTVRASTIVRNLLDFSRAQASEMEPMYIDFVLHKTTDLIANELRLNKIDLHKEFPAVTPPLKGNLQQLQQVFLNLILNAKEAIGEKGSITLRISITENGYIRTDVIDTGPGIAEENIDKIFDPFFTTKEAGKGTGLGLSIVYGIIKKHGGYIEVKSKLNEGTTFSVFLPIHSDS